MLYIDTDNNWKNKEIILLLDRTIVGVGIEILPGPERTLQKLEQLLGILRMRRRQTHQIQLSSQSGLQWRKDSF